MPSATTAFLVQAVSFSTVLYTEDEIKKKEKKGDGRSLPTVMAVRDKLMRFDVRVLTQDWAHVRFD